MRDPLGMVDGLNVYGYVGCNPACCVDPLGLCRAAKWVGGAWRGMNNKLDWLLQTNAGNAAMSVIGVVSGYMGGKFISLSSPVWAPAAGWAMIAGGALIVVYGAWNLMEALIWPKGKFLDYRRRLEDESRSDDYPGTGAVRKCPA